MKNLFGKSALALALALGTTSSWADIITLNQTVSLPAVEDFNGFRAVFSPYILFDSPLLIRQGDTIDLTINFAPGQSVHMAASGQYQAFAMSIELDNTRSPENSSNFTLTNSSFNLVGAQGSFPALVNLPDLTAGHGSIFTNPHGYFLAAGQEATFTGMHARFTVAALENGQNYYFGTWLYAAADRLDVNISPVP
ncbi:MAG: hypothetical protein RL748_1330, partial [Pseudomonadota bacterium]